MLKKYQGPQKGEAHLEQKNALTDATKSGGKSNSGKKDLTPVPKQGKDAGKNDKTQSSVKSKGRDKTPEKSSSSGSDKLGPKKKVQFEGPGKTEIIKSTITDTVPNKLDVLPSNSLQPSLPKLHDLLPISSNHAAPSTKEEEIFVPTALLSHLHHGEESFMNPVTEVSNILAFQSKLELNESPIAEKRKVLDGIARIEVDMEADEPQIFSFHYLYKEYLDDRNLMDPERAQREDELEKRRLAKSLNSQVDKKETQQQANENEVQLEVDEMSVDDENSSAMPTQGKAHYQNLIKSMIARIEFNNCLAPIQDYGRHQQKGVNKKKQKKKKTLGEGGPLEQKEESTVEGPKYDDNFYDLDDNFIDDCELDHANDDIVSDMIMSQTPHHEGESDDEEEKLAVLEEMKEVGPEDDMPEAQEEEDPDEIEMEERYNKLLKVFRVLPPDHVNELIKKREEKLQQDQERKLQRETQVSEANNQNKSGVKSAQGNNGLSSALNQSAEKASKNPKKRKFDEAIGLPLTDDQSIDEILASLKQRFLNGETLNHFKKDIQNLSDKIDKKDPSWNDRLSSNVSQRLANILSKSQTEMLYMLQRTSLLEKKKKKKAELSKMLDMIKTKIEMDMKASNKKSSDDYVDLESLLEEQAKYKMSIDCNNMIFTALNIIEEFVQASQSYLDIKTLEEKAKKNKKQNPNSDASAIKQETVDYKDEVEKAITHVLGAIPERLKSKVNEKVSQAFSRVNVASPVNSPMIAPKQSNNMTQKQPMQMQQQQLRSDEMPRKGNKWGNIQSFYESFVKK